VRKESCGNSFALFNVNDAKLISRALRTVAMINHDFSKERESYDVEPDGKAVVRSKPIEHDHLKLL
jgi:hypothetical protein